MTDTFLPNAGFAIPTIVLILNGGSLIIMWALIREFRRLAHKRMRLLSTLQYQDVTGEPIRYRYPLVWLYLILTLLITIGTSIIIIWQPQIL